METRLETDRLTNFTIDFSHEVAKTTIEYGFGTKRTRTIVRELVENGIAIFVASYLSQCQCSLVEKQLLITCPNIEDWRQLAANLQAIEKKLPELSEKSGLEMNSICIGAIDVEGNSVRLIFDFPSNW